MGLPILIEGESGAGKTYSIKNLDADAVGIFAVEKSRLPFKKAFRVAKNANYGTIMKALQNSTLKTYIIDDSQYLMVNEFFDRAKDTGYQKYTDIGLNFRNLVHFINHNLPDDVHVYFLHHTETDSNTGKTKAKTVGKMLDNYLTLEGCFNIVLQAVAEGKEHYFITQSDGYNTAKSPEDMFDVKIPNDLALVDKTIREYYKEESEEK
jgi:hypothetical protein